MKYFERIISTAQFIGAIWYYARVIKRDEIITIIKMGEMKIIQSKSLAKLFINLLSTFLRIPYISFLFI